ncbi:hypothetical protein CPB83DRAFT_906466 [Crepidotus variabilis]|uniref:Uncharacterized protein n=1 Tax=Crepidotus variabilis TaxID=179855 RepID=A0A9P6EH43_9AGAR|nr:hypothetical protein CPB83DRAFT_906466 [Crepidotus variabilis]
MALNRADPLLYLPPVGGAELVVYHYVVVGTLAVVCFDLLDSSFEDYAIFTQKRWTPITCLYAISRFSTLAFVLQDLLSQYVLATNCQFWTTFSSIFFVLAHASTSAMFLVRASVVYNRFRWLIVFFAFAWVVAVCGCTLIFIATTTMHLGPTHLCLGGIKGPYLMATIFIQCAYDTIICGAITYKLGVENRDEYVSGRWKPWRLPVTMNFHRLEQRFMQDSQIFYLLTMCFKIPEIIIYFALATSHVVPTGPVILIMAFADTAVTSIMAGRMYRRMKLGRPGLLEGAITIETFALDRLTVTVIQTRSRAI